MFTKQNSTEIRHHRAGMLSHQMGRKQMQLLPRGLPSLIVLTDHRPLMEMFCKQLHELDNARLMRMREKLTNLSFKVKWVEGKTHMIADGLSCAPVFQPGEDDEVIDTGYTMFKN